LDTVELGQRVERSTSIIRVVTVSTTNDYWDLYHSCHFAQ